MTGSGLQGRVNNPHGQGTVWASPMRDIAHFAPQLLTQALDLTLAECEKSHGVQAVDRLAGAVIGFVDLAVAEGADPVTLAPDAKTAYIRAGLPAVDAGVRSRFYGWVARLFLSAYFNAVREAVHPGETPIGVAALLRWTPVPTKPRSWLRRILTWHAGDDRDVA